MINTKEKEEPQVSFVGAGPGDVELITVKGLRLLNEADLIIYAGSLINTDIIKECSAEKVDSAGLHLEQIVEKIVQAVNSNKKVVRLHTGDPSIFGAIKEQMQLLDENNISYHIIPGVSSAFGTAASLKAELTLPEVTQTVIITRQEGRTPVPELEKLRSLATHQATMMIFLSVSMMGKVVEELKQGGYSNDTPIAVVEKATWPDEQIIEGTLETIEGKVLESGVRKTAMICVGDVFSRSKIDKMSKLYDKTFSHGTRSSHGN